MPRTPSDADSRAPQVAAFNHFHGTVVGQVGVDAKINEIPAARELLILLDLSNVLVSPNALHTQVDTAKTRCRRRRRLPDDGEKEPEVPVHLGEVIGLAQGSHQQ
ncbi:MULTISPECIES: transposase [Corynebacterium]|uniref:transposase n=1 Tax=Corynebacterium TaxID=1716 RepID=UPI0011D29B96|nr:transposase [Corynebacterium variabile]